MTRDEEYLEDLHAEEEALRRGLLAQPVLAANLKLRVSNASYGDDLSRPICSGLHAIVGEEVDGRVLFGRELSEIRASMTGGDDAIFARALRNMRRQLPQAQAPDSEEKSV